MELYAPSSRVATVEAELALATGTAHTRLLVERAWHLRQRDCATALRLADEAAIALEQQPSARDARALHLRLALTRCALVPQKRALAMAVKGKQMEEPVQSCWTCPGLPRVTACGQDRLPVSVT